MNQTIGHIQCPICDTPGEVRRYKGSNRGTMYWACQCGQIRPVKSQKYILKNAEFYPDAGDLLPTDGRLFSPAKQAEPVTEKPEAAQAAPVTEKTATRKPEPAKPVKSWGFL